MIFPDQYIKALKIAYPKILEIENRDAQRVKEELMHCDIQNFIKKLQPVSITYYLILIHNNLMFFPDKDVYDKLKSIKLSDSEVCWFISLDEINRQFDLIEKDGLILDRPAILFVIRLHLTMKFTNRILTWSDHGNIDEGLFVNIITKYLKELKKRYNGGSEPRNYKNQFDLDLNLLIKEAFEETEGMVNIETLISASKGKTEKMLLSFIVSDCLSYKKEQISETKFLSSLWGLFRTICPDRDFINKVEFDERDILENNFDAYKAKNLKKVLFYESRPKKRKDL